MTVLSAVPRPADAPDDIDYEALPFDADIALQVRIDEIGFYAGFTSESYVPKVNVSALSFTRGGKLYPYEGAIYFGADAKADKDSAIVAAPSTHRASYDVLAADTDAVNAIFEDALSRIAKRVATQFKAVSPPLGSAAK